MTITTTSGPDHRRQPVRAALAALLRVAPRLRPRVEELLWRLVYEAASVGRRDLVGTMNYGYAGDGESSIAIKQDSDRFGLQLYSAVVGDTDLAGWDVLEVGCGRGGGASFVFSQFNPRSLVGLDLARTAIARARARYARPGLDFVAGSAEALPFPEGAFDVVISVESSHCYPDLPRFFAEVRRVLRPNGLLLLADFRRIDATRGSTDGATQDLQSLRDQLASSGLRDLNEQDITSNVVRALELTTPAVRARVERRVPRFLQAHALEFAAVEGSANYRDLSERRLVYLRLALERS